MTAQVYPDTPDGHDVVAPGRLWRKPDPAPLEAERPRFVADLMRARTAVRTARRSVDEAALAAAGGAADEGRIALGERRPVCYTHGFPDGNRHRARTPLHTLGFAAFEQAPG